MANPITCGVQGPSSTTDFATTTAVGWASLVSTAGTIIQGIIKPTPTLTPAIIGVLIIIIIWGISYLRCGYRFDGIPACSAGVIDNIVPAFTQTWDYSFPFAALHDRVDVVVKSAYFPLVQTGAEFVDCNDSGSPRVHAFYHNDAVCNAGTGATLGAVVGVIGGLLVAALAVTAIGCLSWFLCVLALIVAIILVACAAILGAIAGGAIGRAATPQQAPSTSGEKPVRLGLGDVVTTQGWLIRFAELQGANVYWFVEQTLLHGQVAKDPITTVDADEALPWDTCFIIQRPPSPLSRR